MINPEIALNAERAVQQLKNPETTSETVQKIYNRWIGCRKGRIVIEGDCYVVPIEVKYGVLAVLHDELRFPKAKLTEEQRNQLEAFCHCDKKADEYIFWGAGRAAAIAISPIPLSDVAPLVANEGYMIYRLAETYGCKIDNAVVTMLLGVAGGSFAGLLLSSFLPGLKIAVAAGVTYAVGKMSKAYFASGMTLDSEALRDVFASARKEADTIDWKAHKVDESEQTGK